MHAKELKRNPNKPKGHELPPATRTTTLKRSSTEKNLADRIGHFEIPAEIIRDRKNIGAMMELFSNMVVVRCESLPFGSDTLGAYYSYTAICREFSPIDRGEVIPHYRAEIEMVDDVVASIKWISKDAERVAERMTRQPERLPEKKLAQVKGGDSSE